MSDPGRACASVYAVILLMTIGCSTSPAKQEEIDKLSADKAALESEVREYRKTVERLENELRKTNEDNGQLRTALEQAKNKRPVEFVERIVERPRPRPQQKSQAAAPNNPIDEATGLQVTNASARATERNSSWWRYAWVVSIENHSESPQAFKLRIQFMDADGYVVDEDVAYGLSVPAGATKTFRDSNLVDASVAPRIKSVNPLIDR